MQLVVGRIGRAHGISGEVAVDVRTDDPDVRFASGSILATDPAATGPLTVQHARWHHGRLLVRFAEAADRSAAQRLSGTLLVVDSANAVSPDDPDEFWDHDLLGLAVVADDTTLGEVAEVLHLPGQDMLAVRRRDGSELLVPFVRAIVTVVDIPARRLLITPPPGLLDLGAQAGIEPSPPPSPTPEPSTPA